MIQRKNTSRPETANVIVNKDKPRRTPAEAVTQSVLSSMAEGNLPPWKKGWNASFAIPRSFKTGLPYNGWNMLSFAIEAMERGYDSPFWIAKGQARELGITIPYDRMMWGSFYAPIRAEDENGEGDIKYFRPVTFQVCNIDAIDEAERPADPFPINSPFTGGIVGSAAGDLIIEKFFDKKHHAQAPSLTKGGSKAFYVPKQHAVTVPKAGRFDGDGNYYSTVFHEMIHSTGHATIHLRFGKENENAHLSEHLYTFEELIAELGAMMLLMHAGISTEETMENSAAYIAGWSKSLSTPDHAAWIGRAASAAKKAVDYILNVAGAEYEKFEVEEYKPREKKTIIKKGPVKIARKTEVEEETPAEVTAPKVSKITRKVTK